jgi:hypothetical protein
LGLICGPMVVYANNKWSDSTLITKNKGEIMDQYKNEYLSLINDDDDFAAIWEDTNEDFNEWLEVYNIKTIK